MSRTELTDDVLAARIHAACEAQVASVDVGDRPFDPNRPADLGGPDGVDLGGDVLSLPARQDGRHRRGRMLAIAAVLVLVVGLVAVVALRDDDPSAPATRVGTATTTTPTTTSTTVVESAGVRLVAPSTPPLGLPLTAATVRSGAQASWPRTQLFSVGDGGKVLIQFAPQRAETRSGEEVQVHGRPALMTSFGARGGLPPTTEVHWQEDGLVWATAVGASNEELLALLNLLEPRTRDAVDGFQASASSPGGLIAAIDPWSGAAPTVELTYGAPRPPGGRTAEEPGIAVMATAAQSGSLSESHLWSWLYTEGAEKGLDPPVSWYDTNQVLHRSRSGEADVAVSSTSPDVSEEQLSAVADSLEPIDLTSLDQLVDQASDRLAAQPELARQQVGAATVELRGTRERPGSCLVVGDQRSCSYPSYDFASLNGVVVDGRWYISAVSTIRVPFSTVAPEGMNGFNITGEDVAFPAPDDRTIATVIEVTEGVDRVAAWNDGYSVELVRPDR